MFKCVSIDFLKRAFAFGVVEDQTDTERLVQHQRLEEKRQDAIKYLGNKWLLHPDNYKQKK